MAGMCPTKPHIKKFSKDNNISEGNAKLVLKSSIDSGKSEKEALEDFLKASKILYVSKEAYKNAALLKALAENIILDTEEAATKKAAELLISNGINKDFFQIYQDSNGKFKISVAQIKEGKVSDNIKAKSRTNKKLLSSAEDVVKQIREFSKRVTLDDNFEETHIYYIDGRPADTSVTSLVHAHDNDGLTEEELQNKSSWGAPATSIGNAVDSFVRDFFLGKLKSSYSNLGPSDIETLKAECNRLVKLFDKKYGEGNYKVLTEDIHIFGNYIDKSSGEPITKTMVGTIDMLVYDNKGNFHLYDMKTARGGIEGEKLEAYSKQLLYYKTLLETQFPVLKGKIDTPQILYFDTFYAAPITSTNPNGVDYIKTSDNNLMYINDEGEAKHIWEHPAWQSPTLNPSVFLNIEDIALDEKVLKYVSEEDRKALEMSDSGKSSSNEVEQQNATWRTYKGLTPTEKKYLSDLSANLVSNIITILQTDKDAKKRFFGNKFKDSIDFTKMSREEIITYVGIIPLYNVVKERFYSPTSAVRRGLDVSAFNGLYVAYKNFDALIRQSYSKLITLENYSIIKKQTDDIIFTEDIDEQVQEELSDAKLEEKEREAYQMGQRQISAKASLSMTIRRAFEQLMLPEVDEKFKLPTFVNSSEAVDKILLLCNECETIEQMESILERESESTPWIKAILEKIKEEPFRSQFFNNFRKDFTQYSVTYADYDDTGKPIIKTHIINTVSAQEMFLKGIVAGFNLGKNQNLIKTSKTEVNGRGYVVLETINQIASTFEKVATQLEEAYAQAANNNTGKRKSYGYKTAIKNNSKELADVLVKLGVAVNDDMVYKVLASDISGKLLYSNTKTYKLLNNIKHIISAAKKHTNKNDLWNPVLKEGVDKVYSQYSEIARMFGRFIGSAIEPSTYQNGKMYYSFVVPSFMGRTIKNLKAVMGEDTFKRYVEQNYKSDSFFYQEENERYLNDFLQRLTNEENAKRVLDFKVQLSHLGNEYRDLSELGYTISLMVEFFSGEDTAWYRVPTLSNKPSSEFVKWFRYKDRAHKTYKDILCGKFQNLALQEIIRIQSIIANINSDPRSKIDNYDISSKDLKNLPELKKKIDNGEDLTSDDLVALTKTKASNGASFKFLPFLNEHIQNKTELGKYLVDKINGKTIDESGYSQLFFKEFKAWMEIKEKEEIKKWEELGLFETQETRNGDLVFKYCPFLYKTSVGSAAKRLKNRNKDLSDKEVVNLALQEVRKEIEDNLVNYIWNDAYVTSQLIEITSGDIAFYKNQGDFQKRNAQIHSPGNRLNITATMQNGKPYSADGKLRTVNIVADKYVSQLKNNVEVIFNEYIESLPNVGNKSSFKIIADKILHEFDKVDDTDGQAYSCPTSYRKKLGMLGNWTPEMEEAYERIISGKMSIDDLNILMQPLKPFVFTYVMKNRSSEKRPVVRVPMQFKNSEYLILLSDAIVRGARSRGKAVDNQLTAIFDVMEDSCYNGKEHSLDTYNGVGIDTIQFVSCVKTGATGAIDISNKTPKEIRKTLKEAIYEKASDARNNDIYGYNLNVVQTGDFLDYAIQQEVPAHLIEHEQLRGSQSRILSITDFTDAELKTYINVGGKNITVREAIERYQSLLADNIYDSEKELIKELKLTGKPSEKRRALSDLLQESIYKDARYGADLAYACEINPVTGKFNVPLGDPIQSIRIQQLLNSIIKSRINKQKVSGGPVVQTTSTGLSEELNIRFTTKDGKELLTFSEFCKKEKLEQNRTSARKYNIYVKENQGQFSHMEAYISIPSQQLKEDLLIKEGDGRFDSDRVGSFMTIEEGKRYGILNDEMLKAIAYRIPTEDKYSMCPIKIVGFVPSAEEVIMLPKEITLLTGSDFDIDKMYVMLKTFIKDDSGKYILPTDNTYMRDIRNNEVFDIQYELLRHPATAIKMFNPGNFDSLKKTARMITAIENGLVDKNVTYEQLSKMSLDELDDLVNSSETQNILFSTSQVYFHKQNMTAGKLIGMIANANSSHGFISLQDVRIRMRREEDKIYIGGDVIKNGDRLDEVIARDGFTYISKNIASCLAASVDAVKDPVLNFMNLNTFTCNVAMTLLRLGYDIDTMGLFLSQPIIKYAAREWEKANNEGFATPSSICDKILNSNKELSDRTDILSKHLNEEDFQKENLVAYMRDPVFSDNQIRALLVFKKLASIASNVGTVTFLTKFNSVSNAVGPTIADTMMLEEKYLKFKQLQDSNRAPFSIGGTGDIIENSPILKAFYQTTVKSSSSYLDKRNSGLAERIFKDYFVHYTDEFKDLLSVIRLRMKSNLDSKSINQLVNFFMIYKASLTPMLQGNFKSNFEARDYYIRHFPEDFVVKARKLTENPLIQVIEHNLGTKKVPTATLSARTGNYNVDTQETIKAGWTELMGTNIEDSLGYDLFLYNIFRNGFSFSPKTFGHLSSVEVKQDIPGYIDLFEAPSYMNGDIDIWNLYYQFLRNNSGDKRFVPEWTKKDYVEISKDESGNSILKFKAGTTIDDIESLITDTDEDSYFVFPAITFNGDLYMRNIDIIDNDVISDVTDLEYIKVSPLGIPNEFIEVDATKDALEMNSVFDNRKVEYIPYTPSGDAKYELTEQQFRDIATRAQQYASDELKAKFVQNLNPASPTLWTEEQLNLLHKLSDELKASGENKKAERMENLAKEISQQVLERQVEKDKKKLNICNAQ